MKKILITGAGGFVGSRILQQWNRNDALYTLPKGFFRTAGEEGQGSRHLRRRLPDSGRHLRARLHPRL